MDNPTLTITTRSGHRVAAPVMQWIMALVLHRSDEDLVALLQLVEQAQAPQIVTPTSATVPGDPQEWLLPDGRPRIRR